MRTSKDQYKLPSGEIVSISQMERPPQGAVIWNGYDYQNQVWVFQGKKDTRTLEELKASISK